MRWVHLQLEHGGNVVNHWAKWIPNGCTFTGFLKRNIILNQVLIIQLFLEAGQCCQLFSQKIKNGIMPTDSKETYLNHLNGL